MAFQGRITAESIISPMGLGRTNPFLIGAENGSQYVVKGFLGTGGLSLASELICAELGSICDLPIPDYAIMDIPPELIEISFEPSVHNLKGGPAFASLHVQHAHELQFASADVVPAHVQQRLLMFDLWVANGDRLLSPLGGNVNLLLNTDNQLVVIDHNLALIDEPTSKDIDKHVFSNQIRLLDDMAVRASHLEALDNALSNWDRITNLLPEQWLYRDPLEYDEPFSPTLEMRYRRLLRLHDDQIWRDICAPSAITRC